MVLDCQKIRSYTGEIEMKKLLFKLHTMDMTESSMS